uniref:Uncharacterized protein n=1 Tax=Brassica campestris TaxID=3711 RepID=M4D577_BRACM
MPLSFLPPRKSTSVRSGRFTGNPISHRSHLGTTKLHCLFRLQSSPPNQTKRLKLRNPPGTQPEPPPKKPPPTTVLKAKGFIS